MAHVVHFSDGGSADFSGAICSNNAADHQRYDLRKRANFLWTQSSSVTITTIGSFLRSHLTKSGVILSAETDPPEIGVCSKDGLFHHRKPRNENKDSYYFHAWEVCVWICFCLFRRAFSLFVLFSRMSQCIVFSWVLLGFAYLSESRALCTMRRLAWMSKMDDVGRLPEPGGAYNVMAKGELCK